MALVIGRVIGGTILVAAAMVSMPGMTPVDAPVASEAPTAFAATPGARLQAAVERAAFRHVPGASGRGWVLHQLDQSAPRADGRLRVVARGVIGTPGDPGTHVRLLGIYDPASGQLDRVAYELKAPTRPAPPRDADLAPAWSVQAAVQQALADASGDPSTRFALDSAQSLRLEDGGRRFDGVGIGHLPGGEASFISFTLRLSRDGETIGFDYGQPAPVADGGDVLAADY